MCFDGVSKIPVYVMPVLTKMIRDDADLERLAFFVAAYRHYLKHGKYDRGDVYKRQPMQLGEIYSDLSGLLGMPAPQPEPLQAEARRGFSSQRISCSRLLALGLSLIHIFYRASGA